MKPWKITATLLFLCPLLLLISGCLIFMSFESCNLKALDSIVIQDGDLVFRRGKSIESFAVIMTDKNAEYSHIGLIVMEGKRPFVIHVEPGSNMDNGDQVKKESLVAFLGSEIASHYAIYRSHLSVESVNKVTAGARSFYARKIHFDNSYDLTTDQRLYCSELILRAYQCGDPMINCVLRYMEDVNVLIARRNILMPGSFIRSGLFYKICNQ